MGKGGARAGAGRPKTTRVYSDAIKKKLIRALKAQAKKDGRDWLEDLAIMQADPKIQDSVRLGAKRIIAEILVVKESHKTVETKNSGVIEIPMEDPAEDRATAPVTVQ